jgi:predicted Zn-dependent peptidase
VFGFESSHGVVRQKMILDFRGYPGTYLENYTKNIGRVTAADVQRVARTYLDLDHLIFVVVGHEQYFDQPLSSLGTPVRLDNEEYGP